MGAAGSATASALKAAATPRAAGVRRYRRTLIKAPKAATPAECQSLEQLPNIGPALAADLRRIGIHEPRQLRGQDAFALYQRLCSTTGQRHDPCVLDTFMAAVDFMAGAQAAPWWKYTAQRKQRFGSI